MRMGRVVAGGEWLPCGDPATRWRSVLLPLPQGERAASAASRVRGGVSPEASPIPAPGPPTPLSESRRLGSQNASPLTRLAALAALSPKGRGRRRGIRNDRNQAVSGQLKT